VVFQPSYTESGQRKFTISGSVRNDSKLIRLPSSVHPSRCETHRTPTALKYMKHSTQKLRCRPRQIATRSITAVTSQLKAIRSNMQHVFYSFFFTAHGRVRERLRTCNGYTAKLTFSRSKGLSASSSGKRKPGFEKTLAARSSVAAGTLAARHGTALRCK
jgi:hypothetical protein